MAKTIGIISIKGGVGKTTIASALAANLATNFRKKILLIDANFSSPTLGSHMDVVCPHKTIHNVLEANSKLEAAIHSRFGVDVIPGSDIHEKQINPFALKQKIKNLEHKYDYIILDSSPNPNEEMLSTILASDALFVVSTPDPATLSCSLKAAKIAHHRSRPVAGIILNRVRDPHFELTLNEIEKVVGIPVVAKIPDDKNALRAAYTRIPAPIYKKHSSFSKEIDRLCAAITLKPEQPNWFQKLFQIRIPKEQVNRSLLKEDLYKRLFA